MDYDNLWRTYSPSNLPEFCYWKNDVVDEGGFILARLAERASAGEWKAILKLLNEE